MMTHLTTTYGSVSNADLAENLEELDCNWNTNTELVTIFSHNHKVQLFVADNDPISNKTLLGKAAAAIHNTGILNTDLDTFHKCPKAEQTYDNFKKAYSWHTKSTRNTSLLPRLATKALMWLSRSKTKQKTKVRTAKHEPTHSSKDLWYCYYHGIMHAKMTNPDLAQNSSTCKYPVKGLYKTVTLDNICGGNNYFCHIPNEKAVYKHEMYNGRKQKHKEKEDTLEAKKTQEE